LSRKTIGEHDMSAQFGSWHFDGGGCTITQLERVATTLEAYGPDASGRYQEQGLCMLNRAFHTTRESTAECQPYVSPRGFVLTWDGRLDNRKDLIHRLGKPLMSSDSDVSIVAAAHEEWGVDCFSRIIGDWAVCIWDPQEHRVILARDPIGPRHPYYSIRGCHLVWGTSIDTILAATDTRHALDLEYIAGWLVFSPAAHLSPYAGIRPVPPSCYVAIENGKVSVKKYWDFDPAKKARFSSDEEYEEQFRYFFSQAVRRRLRADSPILAELSGGMDSTSIVCMADRLLEEGSGETAHLDTISFYDDSEPNWNERVFFAEVEKKRGRVGCHIDVGGQSIFDLDYAGLSLRSNAWRLLPTF
jgi:asparagine synthase (glutamine-hydrolysing)